jgi:putative membrane protein insertion efficiency factor
MGSPSRVIVAVIRAYRSVVSPMLGRHCRYHPTCSAYAIEAIDIHGLARGGLLALRRIARCHPWAAGGIDRVPARRGA